MVGRTLRERWAASDARTKAMALGAVALIAVSVCISLVNVRDVFLPERQETTEPDAPAAVEDGGKISPGAEPIPFATDDTRYVAALMDVLSSPGCQWAAEDDDLCVLVFTDDGFTEYDGDIVTTATLEFYSIEAEQDARHGIWRVTYEDGTTVDAEYRFYQNRQAGRYSIESDAFPTHKVYKTKAYTSGDVLAG